MKSCRAALVLSQEESERRLSAGQREAAETTCETMLSGVQRMLDELRRALAAEKPPQPPPKPSVADRGVQAGGRERAVQVHSQVMAVGWLDCTHLFSLRSCLEQAGGVDDSTQHDPLLEDGACQTDAPPSARPLVVPLALTVPASGEWQLWGAVHLVPTLTPAAHPAQFRVRSRRHGHASLRTSTGITRCTRRRPVRSRGGTCGSEGVMCRPAFCWGQVARSIESRGRGYRRRHPPKHSVPCPPRAGAARDPGREREARQRGSDPARLGESREELCNSGCIE